MKINPSFSFLVQSMISTIFIELQQTVSRSSGPMSGSQNNHNHDSSNINSDNFSSNDGTYNNKNQ